MKKKVPAWTVLMVICLCAGLLLAGVNMLTADRIREQELLAKNATMVRLFPEATAFEDLEVQESEFDIDQLCIAKNGETVIGYVGEATSNGYGGPIVVTTAVDTAGLIRGISVGGDSFAETPGLGALTKEADFTDQFIGKKPSIVLNEDGVDTVTGASTSSRAVVRAVNAVANYIYSFELGMESAPAAAEETDAGRMMRPRPVISEIAANTAGDAEASANEEKDEAVPANPERMMRPHPDITEDAASAGGEEEETALPDPADEALPETPEENLPDATRLMRPRPDFSESIQTESDLRLLQASAYVFVSSPEQTGWLPLPQEGAYSFTLRHHEEKGDEAVNVIHLTPVGICMESSNCDNQDCVGQGMVTLANRTERILSNMIICLPHQVFLQLYSAEEALNMANAHQAAAE